MTHSLTSRSHRERDGTDLWVLRQSILSPSWRGDRCADILGRTGLRGHGSGPLLSCSSALQVYGRVSQGQICWEEVEEEKRERRKMGGGGIDAVPAAGAAAAPTPEVGSTWPFSAPEKQQFCSGHLGGDPEFLTFILISRSP